MKLESSEIEAIAEALAPKVADLLAEHFSKDPPDWCFSVAEAAAWAAVPEYVVRQAVADGRLPCVRVGRSVRIRRSDLYLVKSSSKEITE